MEALRKNYNRFISLKQAKKLVIALTCIFFFDFLMFSTPAMASYAVEDINLNDNLIQEQLILAENTTKQAIAEQQVIKKEPIFIKQLPKNSDLKVKNSSYHVVTAYNSEIGQTDNSPCITANGFDVCRHGIEDTVAANFLSFGTKIRIPELFGNKIFIVRDRMNSRFANNVDIWMLEKAQAKQLGVKYVKIEILK
ncbi:3D domain-containing protein [Patescibacteria group bacterium]|nr:3D domain-containing protein [Patescibacteria group bacterium]